MPGSAAAVRLPLPSAFDREWIAGFLAERAVPGLETVTAAEIRRGVRLDGRAVVLTIRHEPGADDGALAAWTTPRAPAAEVRRLVARMLDLDTDLSAFYALAARDPRLSGLVAARPGIRLPQFPELFEGLVRAILGQQVSVAAARTMAGRLVRLLGEEVPGADVGGFRVFPRPESMAAAGPAALAGLGLTRAKAASLAAAAEAAADGRLDAGRLRESSPEAAQAALVALPGVGPWTACYVRMRALGDRDAFPAADLGILKALADADGRRPTARRAEALAEAWRPWRAYATLHLWQSLAPSRADEGGLPTTRSPEPAPTE